MRGDIFKTEFSDADVVTTFLLPSMNLRLRPTFLAMKPGTRIVAYQFNGFGDWKPAWVDNTHSYPAYLWVR